MSVAPAGSFNALILDWSWLLTAPVLSPVGFAVMVAARWPSIRVIDTGPSTSFPVITSITYSADSSSPPVDIW